MKNKKMEIEDSPNSNSATKVSLCISLGINFGIIVGAMFMEMIGVLAIGIGILGGMLIGTIVGVFSINAGNKDRDL